MIDDIYHNVKDAVDKEIDQVGELINEAVIEKKNADELELTNMLHQKEIMDQAAQQ